MPITTEFRNLKSMTQNDVTSFTEANVVPRWRSADVLRFPNAPTGSSL